MKLDLTDERIEQIAEVAFMGHGEFQGIAEAAIKVALREVAEQRAEALPQEPTEEIIDAMCDGYLSWADQNEAGKKISVCENLANVYRSLRKYMNKSE